VETSTGDFMKYDSEIIETKYIDPKTKEEKTQYWIASIDEPYIPFQQILSLNGTWNIEPIKAAMKQLNRSWKSFRLNFVPLTENNPNAYESREFHRGYSTDSNPFIFRGKPIPELMVDVDELGNTYFAQYSRVSDKLTPGMIGWLESNFEQQLGSYNNEDFINYLRNQSIERIRRKVTLIVNTTKANAESFLLSVKNL
jgi:hypothetical protein